MQIAEREQFMYPPFCRLIKLTLRHKDEDFLNESCQILAQTLRTAFPKMVLGPEFPLVARIQNYYMKDFWIKFPKDDTLSAKKRKLEEILTEFKTDTKYKSVGVVINVDA